jgi:hypothetical protein
MTPGECHVGARIRLLLLAGLLGPAVATGSLRAADGPAAPAAKSPSVYALLDKQRRWGEPELEKVRSNHVAVLKSRGTVNLVIRGPEVTGLAVAREQSDFRSWLEQHLRVELLDNTGIIRVWVDGGLPSEQAVLVNAVTKAYLEHYIEARLRKHERAISHLERLKAAYEQDLKEARDSNGAVTGQEATIRRIKGLTASIEDHKAELRKGARVRLLEAAEVPTSE